ncbi:MAG: hypothetical protein K2X09_01390 [Rickettsiales bacterium]|nr:hypothetical protein [Rickettsiales bacterium]
MNPTRDTAEDQTSRTAADGAAREKSKDHEITAKKQDDLAKAEAKPRRNFDTFVAKVRAASPAWLVNNGSRISLAFKGLADGLSVWSSLRKGSQSPWRLGASATTLISEVLGINFTEKGISEEQQQAYAKMSTWQYATTKVRQAFNPKEHITETAGVALVANGLMMAMSGVSQSVKGRVSWEIAQGLMTSAAGALLTFIPDRERAWQWAHGTFIARSVPAATHAYNAYYTGVPEKNIAKGDWQTAAKWVANQIANIIGTFFGGIKKLPDGSIVHIGKKGEEITAPKQSRRLVASRDPAPDATPLASIDAAAPGTSVSSAAIQNKVASPLTEGIGT